MTIDPVKKLRNTLFFFERRIAVLYMRWHKVLIKDDLRISGFPFIVNKGTFIIDDKVAINSKYAANPIGGQTFCSFFIAKNASLTIGQGTGISNSAIVCTHEISIGEHVKIGGDCKIYDTDFHALNYNQRVFGDDLPSSKPVKIDHGAFIGSGVTILKGVTIGRKSIVGAGSVVTKNIPDNEIWAGNPARFIRKIES